MKSFNELLASIGNAVNALNWERKPKSLYEPIQYVLSLGGKRIRPALTLMAANLYTDEPEIAMQPALGIEVFHNFIFFPDDIMDRAEIRRGQPTVHKKWNDNAAILSGDAMQIEAYKLIACTPAEHLKEVIDLFSKTAQEICDGQQLDMEFENRVNVTAEEYLEMIRLKTAVLLGCSLKTGAIIGNAPTNDKEELYNFGIHIGLAFQLKDDLLDVYGNEATFGKKIGGDILCNKKTFLLIQALKLAKDDVKEELTHCLSTNFKNPQEKIERVTKVYNQLNVKTICEEKMNSYFETAIANLDKVTVSPSKKQELRNLAYNLLSRND